MARSLLLSKYTQRRSQSPSSYVDVHFSVRTSVLILAGIYRCILYFFGCHCRTVGGDRCAFQLDTVLYLHRPDFLQDVCVQYARYQKPKHVCADACRLLFCFATPQ